MCKPSKQKIKDRVKASNEAVRNGLPADPWVLEYRRKNNLTAANWKEKQPKKPPRVYSVNSGSFKKGHHLNKNKVKI